jgi:hypothetical protein
MIEYIFTSEDGTSNNFKVDLDRVFNSAVDAKEHAFWTKLNFNQCSNCPLKSDQYRHCPAAVDLEGILDIFQKIISYERVHVEVRTPQRTYSKQCDVQTGLTSLLGLVMATSACPILSRLRGLTSFHLPFATMDETIFRIAGAYLLSQYFQSKDGGLPDHELAGLDEFFKQVRTLDECFKKRIDTMSEQDANKNAIVSLCVLAMGVSYSLEDKIEELRPRFSSLFRPI